MGEINEWFNFFFTNENGQTLEDRFNKIIKSNTKYFDVLVGYFRTSGLWFVWINRRRKRTYKKFLIIRLYEIRNNEWHEILFPHKKSI